MNYKTFHKRLVNGRYNQANFQLVVICTIAEKQAAEKPEIIEALKINNKQLLKVDPLYNWASCPVWRVLQDHKHMIKKQGDQYVLNVDSMTPTQKAEIKTFCETLLN